MRGNFHVEKLAQRSPFIAESNFQHLSPRRLRMLSDFYVVGEHGRFPICFEIVVEEALPVFPPQGMHEAGDPVDMLQDAVQPILSRLQQCLGARIVP